MPHDTKPTCCLDDRHKTAADCRQAIRRKYQPRASMASLRCPMARIKLAITRLRKIAVRPQRAKRLQRDATWKQFQEDVSQNLDQLLAVLDSRWMVSILDTYADYGTPAEARNAIMGTLLTTWERAHHTAAAGEKNQTLRPYRDGLKLLATNDKEDAHRNLFKRLGRLMRATPTVGTIFAELLQRIMLADDALLGRLEAASVLPIRKQVQAAFGLPVAQNSTTATRHGPKDQLPMPDQSVQPGGDQGVVTGAASEHWPCLGALAIECHRQRLGLAVADHGLTPAQHRELDRLGVRWIDHERPTTPASQQGVTSPPQSWWKPWICLASPFQTSLWVDADAIITGDLGPLLRAIKRNPCVATIQESRPENYLALAAATGPRHVALLPEVAHACAGIVGFQRDDPLIREWAACCEQILRSSDLLSRVKGRDQQGLVLAMLNRLVDQRPLPQLLDAPYNVPGRHTPDSLTPQAMLVHTKMKHPEARIVHWYGPNKPWTVATTTNQRPPKIAHFVWIGDNPIDQFAKSNIAAFRSLHPTWEVKVWNGLPAEFPDDLRARYDAAPLLCQKTDILRIWALDRYGGLYLDCDVIPLRAADDLLDRAPWAVLHWRKPCNAVMCSAAGSAFTKQYLDLVRTTAPASRITYGPAILIRMQALATAPAMLPASYWTVFPSERRRQRFMRARPRRRKRMLASRKLGFQPYGVHVGTGLDDHRKSPSFTRGRTLEIVSRISDSPTTGVEVGAFRCANSAQLLRRRQNLTLHIVDTWAPATTRYKATQDDNAVYTARQWNKIFVGAKRNVAFAGERAKLIRQSSVEAARQFDNASVDFVFVDAEHSYEAVLEDIEAWARTVKPGGWIGGHDYGHPRERDGKWGVRQAVDEWAARVGLPIERGDDFTWFATIPP